jgi:hypothetical protein
MEEIELYRDLIICISGVLVSTAIIFAGVLLYILYRRAKAVLIVLEATISTLRQMSTSMKDEVIEPVVRLVSLVRGILGGIDLVAKFFHKKEGGSDG